MIVTVHSINVNGKNFSGELDILEKSTIKDLLGILSFEEDSEDLNITNMTVLLNGNRAELNSLLKNGDLIHILTTINGG